jgi:hypothetical protein
VWWFCLFCFDGSGFVSILGTSQRALVLWGYFLGKFLVLPSRISPYGSIGVFNARNKIFIQISTDLFRMVVNSVQFQG